MSLLVESLEEAIRNKGGKIILSSPVIEINRNAIVLEDGSLIKYDDLIMASQLPSELIKYERSKRNYSYTHYDFVVAKLSAPAQICGKSKWFIGYQSLNNKEVYFTSFVQMSSYTDLSDEYIGGYLMWPEGENPNDIESVEAMSRNMIEEAFPNNRVVKIRHIHRWRLTMPDMNIETLKEFKKMQGKDNVWLAGDYLGFPSMDTAIYSGRKAARNILEKYL